MKKPKHVKLKARQIVGTIVYSYLMGKCVKLTVC